MVPELPTKVPSPRKVSRLRERDVDWHLQQYLRFCSISGQYLMITFSDEISTDTNYDRLSEKTASNEIILLQFFLKKDV